MTKPKRTKRGRLYEAVEAVMVELDELVSDLGFEDDAALLAHAQARWPKVVEALTAAITALAASRARKGR